MANQPGLSAPYVRVFTSAGEVRGTVTNFSYRYSQEKDDVAQIRIQSSDVNLADYPEYQEGAKLIIEWGFLGEQIYTKRKVAITDIKATFSQNTIALDLLCTDESSRLKSTSRNKVWKDTDLNKLGEQIATEHGLKFNGVSTDESGKSTEESGFLSTGPKSPGYIGTDGNYKIPIDNTQVQKTFLFKNYQSLPQANKSDFSVLKEVADNQPGGPFEVTGRDDELIIQKIPLSQKPFKIYSYGKDDGLLEFYPETKATTEKAASTNISVAGFDPENKTSFSTNANESNAYTTPLGDIVDVPHPEHTYGEKLLGAALVGGGVGSVLPGVGTLVGAGLGVGTILLADGIGLVTGDTNIPENPPSIKPLEQNDYEVKKTQTSSQSSIKNVEKAPESNLLKEIRKKNNGTQLVITEQNGMVAYKEFNTQSEDFLKADGNNTASVDNTSIVLPYGGVFPYSKQQPSVESSPGDAHGKASNQQAKASLEKNPASAKVIGDPLLKSGIILTINNVSKKFSGNYYVTECTHDLDFRSGYTISLELKRNALSKTTEMPPNKNLVSSVRTKLNNQNVNKQIGPIDNTLMGRIIQKNKSEDPVIPPDTLIPNLIKSENTH